MQVLPPPEVYGPAINLRLSTPSRNKSAGEFASACCGVFAYLGWERCACNDKLGARHIAGVTWDLAGGILVDGGQFETLWVRPGRLGS